MSLAKSVTADAKGIRITLDDGRVITEPLTERLRAATPAQRRAGHVEGFGTWLRWDEIDEDIEVCHVLGVDPEEFEKFAGFTVYGKTRE